MAINLDKLRKEYEKIENSGGNDEFLEKFLQLKDGEIEVKILPSLESWDDDKLFFSMNKLHYLKDSEGNSKTVHCLKVHGEDCPICSLYYKLWEKHNELAEAAGQKKNNSFNTPESDLARKIKPRERYYMNVLDLQSKTVKILSCGKKLQKIIIGGVLDEDLGEKVLNLESGHTLKIIKADNGGYADYTQSKFRPKLTSAGTKAEIAAYLDSAHDIHALIKKEDYDDLRKLAKSLYSEECEDRPVCCSEDEENDYLKRMQE